MRSLFEPEIEAYRKRHPAYGWGDGEGGYFVVGPLRIIASSGLGWDHVSVSCLERCPKWEEMDRVKRMFFKPEEIAYQLHPAESEHVNYHPYCLHLWRCQTQNPPLPPKELIAPGGDS